MGIVALLGPIPKPTRLSDIVDQTPVNAGIFFFLQLIETDADTTNLKGTGQEKDATI